MELQVEKQLPESCLESSHLGAYVAPPEIKPPEQGKGRLKESHTCK